MRALAKIVATGAIAATALGVGIGTALADPPSGTNPATTDIVGVGSDTTTYLLDQVSTDYNATSPAHKLYSWDATGSANIQTKGSPGSTPPSTSTDPNCYIARPNGSGAGISTLNAGLLTHDSQPCVDFARSSRPTSSTDPTGYVFDAFARDAITWSANSGGHVPAGASLTFAQLGEIYSCNFNGTGKPVTWANLFSGASSDAIVPVLPQSSSGTRTTFLQDIGVTTPGSCVVNGTYNGSPIEENEGTNPVFSDSSAADEVYPYSVGAFISQVDTKSVTAQQPGKLLLQDLTNSSGVAEAPVTGSGSTAKISTLLPTTAYRLLFNVFKNAGTASAPAIPTYLQPVFATSANGGWICKSGGTDINKFGFLTISNCGALTVSQ